MEADKDGDGKLSFNEFANMVSNTVSRQILYHNRHMHSYAIKFSQCAGHREANDAGRPLLSKDHYLVQNRARGLVVPSSYQVISIMNNLIKNHLPSDACWRRVSVGVLQCYATVPGQSKQAQSPPPMTQIAQSRIHTYRNPTTFPILPDLV